MAVKKRKTAAQIAGAKKAAATRRRNAKTTPARTTRRRRTPAKKGMLSEMFNPAMTKGAMSAVLSGAAGGAAVFQIEKLMQNNTPMQQNLALGVGAFLMGSVLKMPNMGAGIAAATVYKMFLASNGGVSDGSAFYADPIEQLPMMLDENGDEMYLSEGEEMYLSQSGMVSSYGGGYGSNGF